MQFRATIHKITTDEDGETTLTIRIPLTEWPHAKELPTLTKQIIDITIDKSEIKPYEL